MGKKKQERPAGKEKRERPGEGREKCRKKSELRYKLPNLWKIHPTQWANQAVGGSRRTAEFSPFFFFGACGVKKERGERKSGERKARESG